MKVLVLDDDEDMRSLVAAELSGLGYSVAHFSDAQTALGELEKEHHAIAIVDWNMPSMNGLEFIRRVRQRREARYTFCILLTARTSREDYLRGMDAGADDFLSKPIDFDVLFSRLSVACRVLKLEREVVQLSSLLPICMICKAIRDDDGEWQQMEKYISAATSTSFSHGYCPTCYAIEERRLDEE